jgi:hypothetical protein
MSKGNFLAILNIKEMAYSATDSVAYLGTFERKMFLEFKKLSSTQAKEVVAKQIAFKLVIFSINSFGNFQSVVSGQIAIIFSCEF